MIVPVRPPCGFRALPGWCRRAGSKGLSVASSQPHGVELFGAFAGSSNMDDWKKPEFVEIRMDAEINCYSSALADDPRRVLKQPLIRDNGSETSHQEY